MAIFDNLNKNKIKKINDKMPQIAFGEIVNITTVSDWHIIPENTKYYLANAYVVKDDSTFFVKGINKRSSGGYTILIEGITENTPITLFLVWIAKAMYW